MRDSADAYARAALLYARARRQLDRGRLDLGRRSLLHALESTSRADGTRTPDGLSELEVRVLIRLSAVELDLGHEQGMNRLDQARVRAAATGDPRLEFAVLSTTAYQQLHRGHSAEASFAAAEALLPAASAVDACTFHLNRGTLRLERLQLDLARSDLRRCLLLAADDTELAFMARHNLGYLEFLAGNLPLSLQLMDEAAARAGEMSLGVAVLDKARVLIEAGLSDAADQALAEAAAEFRRGRRYREVAEVELARAEAALLAEHPAQARALARSAASRFRQRGELRRSRLAELVAAQADLASGRPARAVLRAARRLADELAGNDQSWAETTAGLLVSLLLLRAGDVAEAERRLAELTPPARGDPIGLRLQRRVVAVEVQRAHGHLAAARTEIGRGLRELGRHQAQFGSIDLQTAAAIHGRDLVRLDLATATRLHRPGAVFTTIERGRAVSRRLSTVTAADDESAPLLSELRQLTERLRAGASGSSDAPEQVRDRERRRELYRELEALSWRTIGPGGVAAPATMTRVHAAVRERDRTLVSYCQSAGSWSAVVLGRGRARLVDLPVAGTDDVVELTRRAQADLNALAYATLPRALRQAVTASATRTLATLDRLLVAPLRLGDEAVVVVPTGLTATLPWGCLPRLRGRPVEVAPTATSWLSGAQAEDLPDHATIRVSALSGPGIPTGGHEVGEVAALWAELAPAQALTGRDATRAALAAAMATDTIVHVAAHGNHVRQNPLFSSLTLADGPLFAYELAERQVPPHVVLSACELGQVTTRAGDEALGLTRVLLQLGTQCAIAGVTQVSDERAAEVMALYHRRLAAGADSATAIAAATEHGPYAPFVCFGSAWRARPPAQLRAG